MGVSSRQVSVRDASARPDGYQPREGRDAPLTGQLAARDGGLEPPTPWAARATGCRPLTSVVIAELVRWYMVVARSHTVPALPRRGVRRAHEQATPLRYTYGSPIPWRTQWDPHTAVSPLPSFAYAPSVPHAECAGVSAPRFNRKGCELNPVRVHAAPPPVDLANPPSSATAAAPQSQSSPTTPPPTEVARAPTFKRGRRKVPGAIAPPAMRARHTPTRGGAFEAPPRAPPS